MDWTLISLVVFNVLAVSLSSGSSVSSDKSKASCTRPNGDIILHGQAISSENDPCERCFCRKGTLKCRIRTCPQLNCRNPSIRPKKCCPICRHTSEPSTKENANTTSLVTTTEAPMSSATESVTLPLVPPPVTPPPLPPVRNETNELPEIIPSPPTTAHTSPIVPPPPMPPTPPITIIRDINNTNDTVNADYTDTDIDDDELSTVEPESGVCRIKCKRGPRGERGPPGRRGHRGKTGKKGPRGSKGDPGEKGDHGSTGVKGATGPIGTQGPIGPTGIQGPHGTVGDSGEIGPRGRKGSRGDAGLRGLTGFDGFLGPIGPPGRDGMDVKGGPGDMGPRGPPGSDGSTGATGPTGPEGPSGTPGEAIVQGQIVIVPNESAMNRIQAEASIAYRTDDRKLYYRDDTTWNCLVTEGVIEEVKDTLSGAPGPQGLPGPTGPKGDKGDVGIMGDDGLIMEEAVCGNGIMELQEQCDDGNDDPRDSCIACRRSYCGDGFAQRGLEECDGGDFDGRSCESVLQLNTIGSLRCSIRCTIDIKGCTVVSRKMRSIISP